MSGGKFTLVDDAIDTLRQRGLVAEIEESSHFKVRFTNSFGVRASLRSRDRHPPALPFTIVVPSCGAFCGGRCDE